MGKLKRIFSVALIGLCASACFAKQICFQVVQHDETAEEVTEESLIVEDEILTSFFESGYIVTNANAAVSKSDSQDGNLYREGIREAFNGYSDYFIQINLFYSRTEDTTTKNADLQKVKFTIANANTGTTIADKSFENIKASQKKDDLKKISLNLVTEINKALKTNKA